MGVSHAFSSTREITARRSTNSIGGRHGALTLGGETPSDWHRPQEQASEFPRVSFTSPPLRGTGCAHEMVDYAIQKNEKARIRPREGRCVHVRKTRQARRFGRIIRVSRGRRLAYGH